MRNISEEERRLLEFTIGLNYNGDDVPEDTSMKQIEMISFFDNYLDYINECFLNNEKPISKEDFKYKWNGIWNADLAKMKVGSILYLLFRNNVLEKRTISKINIDEEGVVSVILIGSKDEYVAGELYKTNSRWSI